MSVIVEYNYVRSVPVIKKHIVRTAIEAQGSDFAFWQTQPHQARLAALEEIRQEYNRWRYGARQRFQRVYRLVKR